MRSMTGENGARPDAMGLSEFLSERFNLGWGLYEDDMNNFAGVFRGLINRYVV